MEDELIEEQVAIVESSMSIATYKVQADNFADFIRQKRKDWKQDTVLYKIEDRVFVYPHREYIDDDKSLTEELIRVI